MMKIYLYDDKGLFISEGVAMADVMVEGRFAVPVSSTITLPPKENGKVAVFTTKEPYEYKENEGVVGSWSLKEDHRGKAVYDTASKEKLIVDYIGVLKTNHTIKKPTSKWQEWSGTAWVGKTLTGVELLEWKTERLAKINEETENNISKGFEYDGNSFSLSSEAQINWSVLKSMNDTNNYPLEMAVSTKDDGEYKLTKEKATEFFNTALTTVVSLLAEGRAKKIAVKKLTTYKYETTTN